MVGLTDARHLDKNHFVEYNLWLNTTILTIRRSMSDYTFDLFLLHLSTWRILAKKPADKSH